MHGWHHGFSWVHTEDDIDFALAGIEAALQEAVKQRQPNKYIVRVANRAVNDLLGTENRVP